VTSVCDKVSTFSAIKPHPHLQLLNLAAPLPNHPMYAPKASAVIQNVRLPQTQEIFFKLARAKHTSRKAEQESRYQGDEQATPVEAKAKGKSQQNQHHATSAKHPRPRHRPSTISHRAFRVVQNIEARAKHATELCEEGGQGLSKENRISCAMAERDVQGLAKFVGLSKSVKEEVRKEVKRLREAKKKVEAEKEDRGFTDEE
jgi:hypothetical protein